jgi:hypothetical protein
MTRALKLAGMMVESIRDFLTQARAYGELSFDERHLFWKKIQAVAFLVLMPVFLALGAAWRVLGGCTREGAGEVRSS